MKIFHAIYKWLADVADVFRCEFGLLRRDAGVLLFFFGLPLFYPIVYTLIYNPEVVRDIPIAVVDLSHTAESRSLTRHLDATSAIAVNYRCANMAEARDLMARGEIYGILEIPRDYARDIGRGTTAHADFYSDMSLLLRYRTFVGALTDVQLETCTEITANKLSAAGISSPGLPISNRSHFMGDPEEGYASFIIPGIVILILQQSMLLGITMIGATSRERRRFYGGRDPLRPEHYGPGATVWGRALVYFLCYVPMTIYILHWIPEIFGLPHYGSATDYLLLMVPMLLATAFMGQVLIYIVREREMAFIIFVFSSVIFLFLSGMVWPRYAMSKPWLLCGDIIPGVWGIEGFIRINNNGASLADVAAPYCRLWGLVVLYFVAAVAVTSYLRQRPLRKFSPY